MLKFHPNLKQTFSPASIQRKKSAMADVLLRQVEDRIRRGGDDEYTFPPLDFARPDGSSNNPLFHTGQHLWASLKTFVSAGAFGVYSTFKGAKVLLRGTVGKGGTLPTIRPVNANALYLPLTVAGQAAAPEGRVLPGALDRLQRGKDYLFVKKVDIRPRKFFRLTFGNKLELIHTFKEG